MDSELQQMLAKPEFLADPVFSKDQYLAQIAHSLFGHYLRVAQQKPEAFKQVQPAHSDANSYCLKTRLALPEVAFVAVAWTYDLDGVGSHGQTGREIFVSRAKSPSVRVMGTSSTEIMEQVLARRILRVQVEMDENTMKAPPKAEAQICQLKTIGWYVAGLVMPRQQPPGKQAKESPQSPKSWWKFW